MTHPDAPVRLPEPLDQLVPLLEELLESERTLPVRPTLDPAEAAHGLEIPAEGGPIECIVDRLREVVLATPTTSGPRFYNQLFGGREPVAVLAEMLAAATNISMYTYKVAGVQVLIEQILLEHMATLAGLAGGDGLFTPGGSMSNMAAMILARNEAIPGSRESGLVGGPRITYTSAESHYSLRKNAGMIGLGRENVRTVEVDAVGRMIPDELARQIRRDRDAGAKPMMVVATAGTTVMGAFDPIGPIADIASAEQLWLHVDGAFGGSALLSSQSAHLLDGLDRADSFAWDAHKAMGVPLTCSVLLTRRPGLMTKHFDENASYLFQQDSESLNPGTRSLQCGRRNDALKLWALWQHLGDAGFARRTDRQLSLARHVLGRVNEDPELVLSAEPQWLNVCFEVRDKPSDRICDGLDRQQLAKLGWGVVHGRRVIRIVCVNPALDESDFDRLLADIKAVAEMLPEADNAVG